MAERMVGRSLARVEDVRLLTAAGVFIDDLEPPGTLHCAFLRSTIAHGRVRVACDELPDGAQAFLAGDLDLGEIPSFHRHDVVAPALRETAGLVQREVHQPVLARDEVRFVGQPIGVVVARSRALAEDAVATLAVRSTPLAPVLDARQAQHAGAPELAPGVSRNRSVAFRMTVGDVDAAFARADAQVSATFSFGRQSAVPIEPRGALARFDPAGGRLTVWSSTQIPHALRTVICQVLGLAPEDVRVVVPDVGGGFGAKGVIGAEELVVAALALRLPAPVKWIEDRTEHFLSAIHARDQDHRIAVAARDDGTLLALRDDFVVDCGAFDPFGKSVPYNTAAHVPGPYRLAHMEIAGASVLTNKVPTAPYRASGRPEATFARERALDRLARELGLDPLELRRRNVLGLADMPFDTGIPYRDGVPLVYDGPDCGVCLERAADALATLELPPPADGVRRGTGVACYSFSSGKGPYETARVSLAADGSVLIVTGATSQGQSHETVWAQVCADALGVAPDACIVRQGDTDLLADGWGTMASRSAVNAGNAVAAAATQLRGQIEALAERAHESEPGTARLVDGRVSVDAGRGSSALTLSLADVARIAAEHGVAAGGELEAEATFEPTTVTWGCGAHIATVDVDVGLRTFAIVDYVAAYDHGPLLNPSVVEGQLRGGILQGIGGGMLEELVYDKSGEPLTSLMDYLLPTATELPRVRLLQAGATPTDRNPLGIRGLGEAGTVAPAAAIANAVEDALAELGVRIDRAPVTAQALHDALERGRVASVRR
jgi:carbon-monoxide dehydrogenase large subunit